MALVCQYRVIAQTNYKLQTVAAELGLQNFTKKKKLTKLRDASEKDLGATVLQEGQTLAHTAEM